MKVRRASSILGLVGTLVVAVSACSRTPAAGPSLTNTAPPARSVPFSESVFGVTISDPYRWMEDPANAASMTEWVRSVTAANTGFSWRRHLIALAW
jgi:hypothetical protein